MNDAVTDRLSSSAGGSGAPSDVPRREAGCRPGFLWIGCALSGLLGGVVYSHWIAGVSWDSDGTTEIPIFALGSWLVAWVALIPYFMVFLRGEGRNWIRFTFLFGTLWHLSSLVWLATLFPFNPFIPLGIVLLAVSLTSFTLLFAWSSRILMNCVRPLWWPAVLATCWTGTEYLRTLGPFAFPWNFLGHSQVLGNTWGCQIADLGGVLLVSWILVYTNAIGAMVCLALMPRSPLPHTQASFCNILPVGIVWLLLVVFQFVIYPLCAPTVLDVKERALPPLHVAVVQPNIPQFDKMRFYTAPDIETANALDYEMTTKTIQLLERACSTTAKPLDLIVMPESSFNSNYFVYDRDLHKTLEDIAERFSSSLLFGADRREQETQYTNRLRHAFQGNPFRDLPHLETCEAFDGTTFPCERKPMVSTVSAFYVTPADGLTTRVYDKIHLVPFGETAPLVDKIPYFQEWVLMVGSYARGTEYTLFPVDESAFGVMICFESTFSTLARAYVRRGAGMICVITNDAWYDRTHLENNFDFWCPTTPSIVATAACAYSVSMRKGFLWLSPRFLLDRGPIQHFAHAVLRAIETRRPVVRSANTGISATIAPSGEIRQWLGWKKQGFLYDELQPTTGGDTLYTRLGDWPGWLGVATISIGIALWVFTRRSQRARPTSSRF